MSSQTGTEHSKWRRSMAGGNELAGSRLHAIAACLNVPVETFYDTAATSEAAALTALVLLCLEIKTPAGTNAAIQAVSKIIERENAKGACRSD